VVAHNMGAAFMLLRAGAPPFPAPLSVLLFEPDGNGRRRMRAFVVLGGATALYVLWALTAYRCRSSVEGENSIVYINQATNNSVVALLYVIATCGSLFLEGESNGTLRRGKPGDSPRCFAFKSYAFTPLMVCLRGDRQV